jgi:murein DD-endopeptidase MepM/ murein hydrolase activator NlpD
MIRLLSLSALLAALFCGVAWAQEDDLPFKRTIGLSGTVTGELGQSALAAGVPADALAEVLHVLATTLDIDHDVHEGDRFYIRFQQTFTLEGAPRDGGHAVWAELQLAAQKTTVAIHRFRPRGAAQEAFWLTTGQSASAPALRFPVSNYVVSSGFGMRVDPLDQPSMLTLGPSFVQGAVIGKGPTREPAGLPHALGSSTARLGEPTALGFSMGLSPYASTGRSMAATRGPGGNLGGSLNGTMALHEGVDLVVPYGTPILAAGDGVVKGAEPKGRYGNWIQLDHDGDLSTVYGHLASFAPGVHPGAKVSQGDLIGYVGLTGRTTGAHVHFEVRFKGRPVNPTVYSALKRTQLSGPDMVVFRKLVARNQADRDGETKSASAGL